eukprot:9272027-Alexandrium_andersonii.AAC.1
MCHSPLHQGTCINARRSLLSVMLQMVRELGLAESCLSQDVQQTIVSESLIMLSEALLVHARHALDTRALLR